MSESEFLLTREDMIMGLRRLGELANENGIEIKLALVGGAIMVLEYNTRSLTHDVDAVILAPAEKWKVFELVRIVAQEFGWPENWLNDDVEIFIGNDIISHRLFLAPGIEVHAPETAQMLALKLSAWRGDFDKGDAAELLKQMSGSRQDIWQAVRHFVVPGCAATAEDAFNDLWNDLHDESYWSNN
jgi:hypothetical protein